MADHRIVRLQVQRRPLKSGRAPLRSYDPTAIVEVQSLTADPRGVRGLTADDETILDVHHQDHPQSRDRKGQAGFVFMGTGDYAALRERYGAHLLDGIAGETILLDAPIGFAGRDLSEIVTIATADGPLELLTVRPADPCVEFSRYCLRQEPSPVVDGAVRQALIDLDNGLRGYRAVAGGAGRIAVGDIVRI